MTPGLLESCRDLRSTNELLEGIVHVGTWEGRSDRCSDFWASTRNYQFYAGIAAWLKPTSVLEVGVRMGYSLISMCRGYTDIRWIVGIDTELAFQGSQQCASENLRAAGFAGKLDMPIADYRWVGQLYGNSLFDIVHIDGGHTAKEVERDIIATWSLLRPGGTLIADDTDYVPDIPAGIESARSKISDVEEAFYFPTFRGWWVAKRRATP